MKPLFWVGVNLIGFMILVFMYNNIDKKRRKKTTGQKIFGYLQIVLMLYLIFDTGMYLIDGMIFNGARIINYIFSIFYFLMIPIPGLLFIIYCDYKTYNDVNGSKKRFWLYAIPAAINTLTVLLTPFTNMLFFIDENNVYTRGGFFWITVVVGFVYLASYLLLAIKTKNKRAVAPHEADIYLYLNPIPPIIFSIIQIFFNGSLLLGIGFVISAYFLYTNNIQSSEDKRKLSVRFNNINIAHFAIVSIVMIVGMLFSLEIILGRVTERYTNINEAKFFLPFGIITVLFILFVFSTNRIIKRLIFNPLKLLVDSLRQMKENDEHELFGMDRDDEIGLLSNTIHELFIKGYYDGLTGIHNRRYMESTLQQIITTLSRAESKMSVMLIDIDFFKKYNDTYGHIQGDECLRTIAQTINRIIERKSDFAARYGGEEFAVILPNTDEKGARRIAEKLLKAIRDLKIPHINNEGGIATVSIGVTTSYKIAMQNSTDFIKKADEALYLSKNSGRNRQTFLEMCA